MISKRLFLILGGTVGGLGAVVSITPPQFGTSGGLKTLGSKSTSTTPAAPQSASVTGTFTGNAAQTAYGPVQVQVTVSNGKITRVSAPVYPTNSFRDQSINSQAIPLLIQEVMQAQSANIQGVGGASYTSQGFYDSLLSALKKAGM
jgi:uncharacterized protein with FMN-binding domain